MAVTMDLAEHHMFCGGSDGSIFQVDLCAGVSSRAIWGWLGAWAASPPALTPVSALQPVQREQSFQPEQEPGKVFRGHRNQVTCLSVSTDGSVLLSGSHDESVRLWDVQSKQCMRTVTLKGPVTNAAIVLAPVAMLSSDSRPSLPLPPFNRHLLGAEHGDDPRRGGLALRLGLHRQVRFRAPGPPWYPFFVPSWRPGTPVSLPSPHVSPLPRRNLLPAGWGPLPGHDPGPRSLSLSYRAQSPATWGGWSTCRPRCAAPWRRCVIEVTPRRGGTGVPDIAGVGGVALTP